MSWLRCVAFATLWPALLPACRLGAEDPAHPVDAASAPGAGRRLVDGGDMLEDLDWMVGDWVVVDDRAGKTDAVASEPTTAVIEMKVRWNANRTFLLRDVKIMAPGSADETAALHVTQRIGWDPLSRQIRSWVFSSDGGYGEAAWSRDGDSWVARTTGVLPDGTRTASLNVYTFDGKDRCTWRSLPTHVGGEHTPPLNLEMIRKGGKP